jgi:ribonuclease P/MRP protein subunit RPP1
MKFYDLHLHSAFSEGTSSIEQLASTARHLGYTGICFAEYFKNLDQIKRLYKETEKVKQKVKIEIYLGFEARNLKELAKLANIRRKFDVLLVRGGDLKLNRLACETPEVDILTHPEYERFDSGLNHVLVKEAARNNVAIEVNFREILITSKNSRSRVLHNIAQNIKLAKKYHAPIILCSGAISHFELRSPECLISMANQLGLELNEAKNSISEIPEKILLQTKERKGDKWVLPGVKVIK